MLEVAIQKKMNETPAPRGQKTFERLRLRIQALQGEHKRLQEYLDESLLYYSTEVKPEKTRLAQALSGFIKVLFTHHETSKIDTENNQALEGFILDKIEELLSVCPIKDLDSEVQVIYQALTGKSCDDSLRGELESAKRVMEAFLAEQGVDIKFDNIDIHDDQEEMIRKMMEAVQKGKEAAQKNEEDRSKTKKELQKEQKRAQLKELQQKGVGSIYKQLAKMLHPDLEPCPEKKLEKEHLMKRLTVAYKNDDIHDLLSVEMEWFSSQGEHSPARSPTDLKIYNAILKDQIKELDTCLEMLPFYPKYVDIQPFTEQDLYTAQYRMDRAYRDYQADAALFRQQTKELQGKAARRVLGELLDVYQNPMQGTLAISELMSELFESQLV